MKVVKSEKDPFAFEGMFKKLVQLQTELVFWQISPQTGERLVSTAKLISFEMGSGELFFDVKTTELHKSLPTYCYSKTVSIIFKAEIIEHKGQGLVLKFPQEIKVLDVSVDLSDIWKVKRLESGAQDLGPDILRVKSMSDRSVHDQKLLTEEFFLSLDEEDKLFADKRESPRARPSEEKWVKVAKLKSSGPNLYKLYDLSRGGLGFLTLSENDFSKGMEVHIVGFNEFDLDDPFIGEVMSVRPTNENFTEFKVGVKFSAGQD